MLKSETSDMVGQAMRGAPAVAGVVASAVTLSEWIAVLTGLYVITQMFYLIWKWKWERIERKAEFDRKNREEERAIRASEMLANSCNPEGQSCRLLLKDKNNDK